MHEPCLEAHESTPCSVKILLKAQPCSLWFPNLSIFDVQGPFLGGLCLVTLFAEAVEAHSSASRMMTRVSSDPLAGPSRRSFVYFRAPRMWTNDSRLIAALEPGFRLNAPAGRLKLAAAPPLVVQPPHEFALALMKRTFSLSRSGHDQRTMVSVATQEGAAC